MKRGAVESPKIRRLSKRLGVGLAATVGHLELLWHFTAKQAPAGDVGRWADDEIADACDWEGDPAAFVDALVAARWLDPCPHFRLIVHDWHEHADDALRKAMRRRDASLRGVRWEDANALFATPRAEISESSREAWRSWRTTADNGGQRQPSADNGGQNPPSPPGPARPGPACVGAPDGVRRQPDTHTAADATATARREAAESIADDWRPLRLAVDPADPIADPKAWKVIRGEQAAQVVRLLQAGHSADLIRQTLTWAMHDATAGGGTFRGWKFEIGTLADFGRHFATIRKAVVKSQTPPGAGPPGRPPEPQPSKRYRPAAEVLAETLSKEPIRGKPAAA
jgi:hypothetical protein